MKVQINLITKVTSEGSDQPDHIGTSEGSDQPDHIGDQ